MKPAFVTSCVLPCTRKPLQNGYTERNITQTDLYLVLLSSKTRVFEDKTTMSILLVISFCILLLKVILFSGESGWVKGWGVQISYPHLKGGGGAKETGRVSAHFSFTPVIHSIFLIFKGISIKSFFTETITFCR